MLLNTRDFKPDYQNIVDAARNIEPKRLPFYEHLIADTFMEKVLDKKFANLLDGNYSDKLEYFRITADFFKNCGFDTVTYECCMASIFPEGGALGGHVKGVIQTREDFNNYPWDSLADVYFKKFNDYFRALSEVMPEGMKVIGGVGNGVFECVQDLVGYQDLCFMMIDDAELYGDMFVKIGDLLCEVWDRFLKEFGDIICVCRFGDDLGFKSQTLLPQQDVKEHIIPQYKRVIDIVHSYKKPFLLHSCGNIFDVMDDIIDIAGIDAKHSNEDQIALFPEWVERYGDRIGNFGGIDTDMVCRADIKVIKDYAEEVLKKCHGRGGFAFGTGNAVADYVDEKRWLAMNETAREYRKA